MDEIAVSKFKATCLSVLDRVRRTGRPLRVTRFGEPLADIMPPRREQVTTSWLGAMRGRGRMADDLIQPAEAPSAWDSLK